jgi:hypothetical protein
MNMQQQTLMAMPVIDLQKQQQQQLRLPLAPRSLAHQKETTPCQHSLAATGRCISS